MFFDQYVHACISAKTLEQKFGSRNNLFLLFARIPCVSGKGWMNNAIVVAGLLPTQSLIQAIVGSHVTSEYNTY